MKINKYEFGQMCVNGTIYTSDIIISNSCILSSNWRRIKGHEVHLDDIKDISFDEYDVVIVGQGYYSMMKLSSNSYIKIPKEVLHLRSTQEAVLLFNKLVNDNLKVIGLFHLTC